MHLGVCLVVLVLRLLDLRFTNNSLCIIGSCLGDVFSILPLCLLGSISNGLNHLCSFRIARSGMESGRVSFTADGVCNLDFVFLTRHDLGMDCIHNILVCESVSAIGFIYLMVCRFFTSYLLQDDKSKCRVSHERFGLRLSDFWQFDQNNLSFGQQSNSMIFHYVRGEQ
ncbi:hypothetical protein BC943DRAFT_112417 [Umbelopsis sp. AD052]|nr:hypothetical protein BC943DRAFT_112417 [Umbelopsis sp. AD052]